MPLTKHSHIRQVVITFDENGIDTIETHRRTIIMEDGKVLGRVKEEDAHKTYTPAKMQEAVTYLLDELERVGVEDDAERAAAAIRREAVLAEREAAARKLVENQPAEA